MARAHELCKIGVSRFGGKHSEYFSEALKIANAEAKQLLEVPEKNKTSFVTLLFITLFVIVFSFFSNDVRSFEKPINIDIPIDFINMTDKVKSIIDANKFRK